jgi:hypothetical protein
LNKPKRPIPNLLYIDAVGTGIDETGEIGDDDVVVMGDTRFSETFSSLFSSLVIIRLEKSTVISNSSEGVVVAEFIE